ncbi:MAG: serine/threonine-protein kinase M1 [Piccolia ochrophora]|nr:MAG: serine/threonine-protein kinase M1 [Piccolia ochrophora]
MSKDGTRLRSLCKEFQYIVALFMRHFGLASRSEFVDANFLRTHQDSTVEVSSLWEEIKGLTVKDASGRQDNNGPPRKRRRTAQEKGSREGKEEMRQLIGSVYRLLGSQNATDLDGLNLVAVNCFKRLSDDDRCSALKYLGYLACAGSNSATLTHARDGSVQSLKCLTCDAQEVLGGKNVWHQGQSAEIFRTLDKLLKTSEFQQSTKPRVWAMTAVRRIMLHSDQPGFLRLKSFAFGQWSLHSLRSSLRELRIAAGRTLPAFLTPNIDPDILQENRVVAIDYLRQLSASEEVGFEETSVLAWGQIARVFVGNELNVSLLRLVEYLGHSNPLVHGAAYNELSKLSQSSSVTPQQLLHPFWRSIAVTVVKDLQTRPQTVQLLSDLLGVTVSHFLSSTQVYTLPYLVLLEKREIIQRIAQAREDGSSVGSMCLKKANIAAILALLMVQPSTDIESAAMSHLRAATSEFQNFDLLDLVKIDPLMIAFELLNAAGVEDDSKKSSVHQALYTLASLAEIPKSAQSKASSRKSNVMGQFFEYHILGIIAQFSDTINDVQGRYSTFERTRSLHGLEEMIKLAKHQVGSALPQIGACLQAALEVDELRDQAFSTWATMMVNVEEEDIQSMIENTITVVIQSWNTLSGKSQGQAHTMLDRLFKKHSTYILKNIDLIPSLASIPLMAKFETELNKHRNQMDVRRKCVSFTQRCQRESLSIVQQALVELVPFLKQNQSFIHLSTMSEKPDVVITGLLRSILDACIRFSAASLNVANMCAQSLGLIGCLDSNKIEAVRDERDIVVLSNFEKADETIDWVLTFLQRVLVKAFMSTTNPKSQGFLAFAMQELLKFCDFDSTVMFRSRDIQTNSNYRRWIALPEAVRNTLTPFLSSRYRVEANSRTKCSYPIFSSKLSHGDWLRTFVLDLLEKGRGENASTIFSVCSRIIRTQDVSIPNFLLPFVVLNVLVGGTNEQAVSIDQELLLVLRHPISDLSRAEGENIKLCSETVFAVLDYLSRWIKERRRLRTSWNLATSKQGGRPPSDDNTSLENIHIKRVECVLNVIPAEMISRRAMDCKAYSRALFHWEQYIRQKRNVTEGELNNPLVDSLFEHLQEIYTQIDEPDGIEGISVHLHVLNIDQQILEHRKSGRWTAAQSWYELQLAQKPDDTEVQVNLLTCLKESGQHDVLLNQVEAMMPQSLATSSKIVPFALEAAWVIGKWPALEEFISMSSEAPGNSFNVSVGRALLALRQHDREQFRAILDESGGQLARGLSRQSTASLQACHDDLLKFHVMSELGMIGGTHDTQNDRQVVLEALDRRLDVLGSFLSDKQYILGVRRAAMQLSSLNFTNDDLASAWLTSAKLARKANFTHLSFNAVMHASSLGAESATIEHSRLLWKEGHHRKAIQSLEGAIAANAFKSHTYAPINDSAATMATGAEQEQNLLIARAHLLLAKWLDSAGQTPSHSIIQKYHEASEAHKRWEKGLYYLGRHYNKLFESEKILPTNKQSRQYVTGETAKLVIHNYLRSLCFGTKYIFQTLPRILTLWLDLGFEVNNPMDDKHATNHEYRKAVFEDRKKQLDQVHSHIRRYIDRLPPYVVSTTLSSFQVCLKLIPQFYTALSQIMARITHPNRSVFALLQQIIVKVVSAHPQQALWTLLAVVKSSSKDRASRGLACLTAIKEPLKGNRLDSQGPELRTLVNQGQKLSEQLLEVCDGVLPNKIANASLAKDLGFNHKTAVCPMVVPLEKTLAASLPTIASNIKTHKAFARDVITISAFLDDVVVLSSLQRPRKISVRGSDGNVYGLLCKPKDDLRKDQRLMEFNAMINRSLKKDADSSKRQLYIKTYAVTPLNELCGLIEWVDNLKTLREILLKLYKSKGITPNYPEIRTLLDETCSDPSKLPIFTEKILPCFPPVFHEWFVEMFPEPAKWFSARLKYTRSCAVMSMIGMVLGLGDRHGENILFEEGNGGTFHVDFNCLFDKGMTFEKPERVPFRLTHNMIDAFGVYGYEDFIGRKKKITPNVPDTPQEVLDSVRSKVRGLLPGESVPLSVEGHVEELIQQATSPSKLSAMYIGWCAFF